MNYMKMPTFYGHALRNPPMRKVITISLKMWPSTRPTTLNHTRIRIHISKISIWTTKCRKTSVCSIIRKAELKWTVIRLKRPGSATMSFKQFAIWKSSSKNPFQINPYLISSLLECETNLFLFVNLVQILRTMAWLLCIRLLITTTKEIRVSIIFKHNTVYPRLANPHWIVSIRMFQHKMSK